MKAYFFPKSFTCPNSDIFVRAKRMSLFWSLKYNIICYYNDIIFYFDYQSLILLKQREKTNYILLENFPGIESTSVGSLEKSSLGSFHL